MRKVVTVLSFFLTISVLTPVLAQDLSGLSFCIDPGHGVNTSNQGPTGLKEHTINVRVARFLESYLKAADADTVILTVTENDEEPGLSAREDIANRNGVDWFHSIHHNAWNGQLRYTLLLYEEIPFQKVPQWPGEADTMSEYMGFNIWKAYRTTHYVVRGDWSFYGGSNGGFNLGVLNDLQMPGELSEATFHDNPIEEAKMRNPDFLRFEALALYKSFLEYFDAGEWNFAPLGGIVYDKGTGKPLDGALVTLLHNGRDYSTDNWHNGFYAFPDLSPGKYWLQISAPGYETITDSIEIEANQFNFLDAYMVPHASPTVKSTSPPTGSENVSPYGFFDFEFSREMNRASVAAAITVFPPFEYDLLWSPDGKKMRLDPRPILQFNTFYTIRIDTTAKDVFNNPLDSDGDGVPGEPYILTFKTQAIDYSRPQVISIFPFDSDSSVQPYDLVRILFNKPLDPSSINESSTYLLSANREKPKLKRELFRLPGNRFLLTFIPQQPLKPAIRYSVTLLRSIMDTNAVEMENHFIYRFVTQDYQDQFSIVDDFAGGTGNWLDPKLSSLSVNYKPTETHLSREFGRGIRADSAALRLDFSFFGEGILDVHLQEPLTPLQDMVEGDLVGMYVFGDSSDRAFRFYFEDGSGQQEASRWISLNWFGWKPVTFEFGVDSIFAMATGNGTLDENARLAGFQLKGSGGEKGTVWFDDLFLMTSRVTEVEEDRSIPREPEIVIQSYPNPFSSVMNHTGITISYKIPEEWGMQPVTVSIFNTLGQRVKQVYNNEPTQPGEYRYFWDTLDDKAQKVPAGVYFFRIQVGDRVQTRRLIVLN